MIESIAVVCFLSAFLAADAYSRFYVDKRLCLLVGAFGMVMGWILMCNV
jgi:hypothetical protein